MALEEKVEPSLTEKAITDVGETLHYRDRVAPYIRGLATADPKELQKQGILKEGKLDALTLWERINAFTKDIIRKHMGDQEDHRWRPAYEQVKALVERLGQQGKVSYDLAEQLVALYVTTAQAYAEDRNRTRTSGAPLAEAKGHVAQIAEKVGQKEIYDGLLNKAVEPTAVVQLKAALEGPLREKVSGVYATTGHYTPLIKKAA